MDKQKICVNVNFFDMGGDSIKVLLLVALINKELQVKISAADIFRFPSISSLVSLLEKQDSDNKKEKMQIEGELFEMGEAINILNNN